jgi:hypothetical protein
MAHAVKTSAALLQVAAIQHGTQAALPKALQPAVISFIHVMLLGLVLPMIA